MKSEIIKSDFNKLDAFIKGLKSGMVVDVGILGNKTARADLKAPVPHGTPGAIRVKGRSYAAVKTQYQTNAEIGFRHEFGKGVPMRSFLRMPIFQYSEQILAGVKKAGALKKLAAGKMIQVLADIGIGCEAVILQAFESGGWGSWKANKPSTVRRKGSSQPLIDTGQLRRSIASAVVNP